MPTTKTKTSPSGLTPEEQKEIERRGFLVKKVVPFSEFILNLIAGGIVILILIGLLSFFLPDLGSDFIIIFCWIMIFFIPLFYISIHNYLKAGTVFYTKNSLIGIGKQSISYKEIVNQKKLATLFTGTINSLFHEFSGHKIKRQEVQGSSMGIVMMLSIFAIFPTVIFPGFFLDFLLYFTGFIILSVFLYYYITEDNPLYAFGNLGSKIQSLTPRITEESEKIEKEFSTDMNFRVLSDSFDALAQDFSKISSYVIKLEQIEKKANKGNLFDSEKYIGSLREDIVKPLMSLRSFLEKKKTELEKSKEELRNLGALDAETSSAGQKVRVRVGGSGNGETENLELQSKRSEPLRAELTENIAKLDVMIEKFGKI